MDYNDKSELRLAVLIDSDNVSHFYVNPMMEEIARYGQPTIKRIYGDWTRPNAAGWKGVLLENAITPIQQYQYTSGKNSTDSSLIIDAMDILYSGNVDGFCIVSSDSDFTRLATRLREAGMKVIGIGEQKTPTPFISACDKFIFLEILSQEAQPKADSETEQRQESGAAEAPKIDRRRIPKNVIRLVRDSVNAVADEDGWAFLGDVGNLILRKQPSFDSRNYGYSKLTPLIAAMNCFVIDKRSTSSRGIKHIYIRDADFASQNK